MHGFAFNFNTNAHHFKLVVLCRIQAIYERSLKVLENVKKIDPSIYTKSGIMVGLGEREDEVLDLLRDLMQVGCDYLTIGQYLAPSKEHYPVVEYVHAHIFKKYKDEALSKKFIQCSRDAIPYLNRLLIILTNINDEKDKLL
ncbi:lipoyl synthase [Tepidibacter aestuarii]|nr:lipoyl synthase [Tepidibacter aestuarii]